MIKFIYTALSLVGLLLWIIMIIWSFGTVLIAYSLYKPRKFSRPSTTPGVSILKPLRGIDVNLEDNLNACFSLDYPQFEILLSVADQNDPVIELARRVMNRFPNVDAQLTIGEKVIGMNPKINNLMFNYEKAKYDVIWICDSNVYVEPQTLNSAMTLLQQPKVGLVHHTPEGTQALTLGAELERNFLNTAHAKIYLGFNWMAFESCVMGKSTLFRKSDLEKCGGLGSFGKYMAEDNMIGLALMKLGLKHQLNYLTAKQPLMDTPISDYLLRRSRWTRIRAYSMPVVTLLEPFAESILNGVAGGLALRYFFSVNFFWFLFFHMLYWFTCDYFLQTFLSRTLIRPFSRFLFSWCLRELSAFPIYLYAIFGSNRVNWRGKFYALELGGTVRPLSLKQNESPVHSFFVWDLIYSLFTFLLSIPAFLLPATSSHSYEKTR